MCKYWVHVRVVCTGCMYGVSVRTDCLFVLDGVSVRTGYLFCAGVSTVWFEVWIRMWCCGVSFCFVRVV